MSVGILLLAAGRGTRFGSDKRFAQLETGRSIFDATLSAIAKSGLPARICLAPKDERGVRLCERLEFNYLVCENSPQGMGSTLAEGVSRLPDWSGVLIALADMPWVLPSTYRQLASVVSDGNICRPVFNGHTGHPVGFGGNYFKELSALSGDTGARGIVHRHAEFLVDIDCNDTGIFRDVDRPNDL